MARKGKQKQFGKPKAHKTVGNTTHLAALQKIQDSIDKSDLSTAYQLAEAFTQQHATSPHGWEMLANVQAQQQCLKDACCSMQKAIELATGDNPLPELKLAQYELFSGDAHQCIKRLTALSERIPSEKRVWVWLSRAYHVVGLNKEALTANDKAYALDNKYPDTLVWRSRILDQLKRHSEAYVASTMLKKLKPKMVGVSNHLASLSLREGDYEVAEQHFKDELAIGPNGTAAYNSFIAKHYNPDYSAEELSEIAKQFESDYVKEKNIVRASTEKRKSKRVRVGLLSGSFRTHPVGQMILPALRAVDKREVELFFYTTNQIVDNLTLEIQKVADDWVSVVELSDEQLSQKIRHDKIDILIDMNGGGEGSKFMALAKEPAPLIVKWVGILINTTGLKCFDYLLSDSIETPRNVDHLYTEKLIRLPDDYVCYHLPDYIPDVTSLPALKNGFVTFGCLNNPAKLSRELIQEWSTLMHEVPNSKLLLRGIQFEGEAFCQHTMARFAEFGIGAERLLLEGPAQHKEFLETYQRIDIALDTWPYSGGLTTCEALAMGVPVITCVGPTFAGRHSATHLANAGLPELVTDDWDDFRKRAKELAADLPSLAVIRAALRTILKESPVCDGKRFAKHFTYAMRAIWQRHCEGKAPEALTFNKEGDAWFAGESEPVTLIEVESVPVPQEASFEWDLDSPIMVMDNGARFARHPRFAEWMQTGNFAVITFDPGSLLTKKTDELKKLGEWQHFPHATLGDGKDTTLFATLDPELTGTLEPQASFQTGSDSDPLRVLSKLPLSSVQLGAIQGLPSVDVIVLDALNDSYKVLENMGHYLSRILVVKVEVDFLAHHRGQLSFSDLQCWASENGFVFYDFVDSKHCGNEFFERSAPASLVGSDAIFVPSLEKMSSLDNGQLAKLSYVMFKCFGFENYARYLLNKVMKKQVESGSSEKIVEQYKLGTRRFSIPELGVEGLFRELNKRGVKYAILRWFETLPEIEPGEDVDILVADDDLEKLNGLFQAKSQKGSVKCDIYSVSGKPGSHFEGLPYYEARLAEEILNNTVVFRGVYKVPSDYYHLLSLAYHAVFHKADFSGLPVKKGGLPAHNYKPDHDYSYYVDHLSRKLGEDGVELSLEGLFDFLESKGWTPSVDLVRKLSLRRPWLRSLYPPAKPSALAGGELACFVIRDKAIELGFKDLAIDIIQKSGFDVKEVRDLSDYEKKSAEILLRGGNWGRGPWPVSGGAPSVIVVAYDYAPILPSEDLKKKHPYLSNQNVYKAKALIRDKVNSFLKEKERFNAVHSADDALEAKEYFCLMGVSVKGAEDYRKEGFIGDRYDKFLLSKGRRAEVYLKYVGGAPVVQKVFRDPAGDAFLAEQNAYVMFNGRSWYPEVKFCSEGVIELAHMPDGSRLDKLSSYLGDEEKYAISVKILRALYDMYGLKVAHRDFHSKNIYVIDGEVKIADFETAYFEYVEKDFWASYDIVGSGLPSPFYTDYMCVQNRKYVYSLMNVLGEPLCKAMSDMKHGKLKLFL